MIYRIKQFIWAFQSFFKRIDYKYVKRYLNEGEFEVFDKLSKVDKVHSIRVSKENLKLLNELKNRSVSDNLNLNLNKIELAKVGLLHDIGKIQNPINIVEKSVLVCLDKITNGKLKKYDKVKKIDTYYNHPKKAINILKDFNYSSEFLEAVEKHHCYKERYIKNNKILYILIISDSKN